MSFIQKTGLRSTETATAAKVPEINQKRSVRQQVPAVGVYFGNRAALRQSVHAPQCAPRGLSIGPANDPFEAEADRGADQLLKMFDAPIGISTATPLVQRKCATCEEGEWTRNQAALRLLAQRATSPNEKKVKGHNKQGPDPAALATRGETPAPLSNFRTIPLFLPDRTSQPQPSSTLVATQLPRNYAAYAAEGISTLPRNQAGSADIVAEQVPTIVHDVLRTPGQPFDSDARGFFERRFGRDFSHVRVHSDEHASKSAEAVNAHAYTVGNDIVFGPGQWSPQSDAGKRLLAHELTHVVQQTGSQQSATVQRDADDMSTDTTAESAYLAAQRDLADGEPDPQAQQYVETLGTTLEQMRVAAGGKDEALKQEILAGFTADQIASAEEQAKAGVQVEGATTQVPIMQQSPTGPAMESLQVSSPEDDVEVEASRVADLVMSGARMPSVAMRRPALGGIINRQLGPQLVTAGAAILVGDAEIAPETGPPGWVVGGVVALAALAVIGVGLLMSSAGNVADTGIMEEARALIAAGKASDICKALAILMSGTSDNARKLKIKATQKAMGCRHSRWSK